MRQHTVLRSKKNEVLPDQCRDLQPQIDARLF